MALLLRAEARAPGKETKTRLGLTEVDFDVAIENYFAAAT
jgi:hypothetical protein